MNASVIHTLETRKQTLFTRLALPPDGLPGSLSQSHYRCGNPRCHCATDRGHLRWSLTFMVDRKKRVAHVPTAEVETVRVRVDAGNAYKRDVAELLAINAQLLVLERRAPAPPRRPARRRSRG